MHLTPDILADAYELLRATPPFKRWKLPHADDVEFHVIKKPGPLLADYMWGLYSDGRRTHRIRVTALNKTLTSVLASMAHEMVHMRQRFMGTDYTSHGRVFRKLAAQVCRLHGYKVEEF